MTHPTSLRIGHARYTVTSDKAGCKARKAEGRSSGNKLAIILRGDRPHDAEADTLLHEVLHQCLFQSGQGGMADQEAFVLAVTGPLLGALRDNPELVAYLLTEE